MNGALAEVSEGRGGAGSERLMGNSSWAGAKWSSASSGLSRLGHSSCSGSLRHEGSGKPTSATSGRERSRR